MSAVPLPACSSPLEEAVRARVLAEPAGDVAAQVAHHARVVAPLLGEHALATLVARVVARVCGLGPLEPLLADPDVSEVMVNGGSDVWVERRGTLERTDIRLVPGEAEHLIERVVGPLGRRVDRTSPIVDARLPDGSRVHAIVGPLAVDGPCLTIRRFAARRIPLAAFCPPGVEPLLRWAVSAGANVLVSGATASGKTTFLGALAALVPPGERIITIEDAAELRLGGDHVVRLEARPTSAEGAGEVTIRDLVRAALRMRPDRIVIGEVRGPEALDMLAAMNTGHEGSLSSCHANGPVDTLRRIETMVLASDHSLPVAVVRDRAHAALDLIVQVARGHSGERRIIEVAEVLESPDDPRRVRRLAGPAGVEAYPARAARRPGAPACPSAGPGAVAA